MKFLVDAQLPRRVCIWLRELGYEALHTLDLPDGNRTADSAILDVADDQDCVVVTKDVDFVQSFMVTARPRRLLLIATGNTSNDELERILKANLPQIALSLETAGFVELGRYELTIHH